MLRLEVLVVAAEHQKRRGTVLGRAFAVDLECLDPVPARGGCATHDCSDRLPQ